MGRIRQKVSKVTVGDRLLLLWAPGVLHTRKLWGGRNDDHAPVLSWKQKRAEVSLWRYQQRAIATSWYTNPTAALAIGPSKLNAD